MMEVLPIPPVPVRAIDVKRSVRSMIVSTNSLRPKKTLGGGGGNSPRGTLGAELRHWVYRWLRLVTCFRSGSNQCLFDGAERMDVTYRPILATNHLTHFHHSFMRIDCYDTGVCSYGMGVGCYGVRVQSQLCLGSE